MQLQLGQGRQVWDGPRDTEDVSSEMEGLPSMFDDALGILVSRWCGECANDWRTRRIYQRLKRAES